MWNEDQQEWAEQVDRRLRLLEGSPRIVAPAATPTPDAGLWMVRVSQRLNGLEDRWPETNERLRALERLHAREERPLRWQYAPTWFVLLVMVFNLVFSILTKWGL